MKLIKLYSVLLIAGLSAAFISCDNNDDIPEPTPKDGVAVKTVEAIASFDLSARKDWKLYIGTTGVIEEYNFNIEGNKLIATSPKKAPYRFTYGKTSDAAVIQLVPENYGRTRDVYVPPLNIENQSTSESFMNCDRLRIDYYGKVQEDLTGLSVKHFNALLNFRIDNLPQDAKVYIEQIYNQKITPLQDPEDEAAYKAIVFPHNQQVALTIEAGDNVYKAAIPPHTTRMDIGHAHGLGNNSLIEFIGEINPEGKLVITEYSNKSNAEWPLTQ